MDSKQAIEQEKKRYQNELKKLREEQLKKPSFSIDDREQDLLEEHYKNIGEIIKKSKSV